MSMLHLTLKKQWFDMIASGEKKEEYREIKPYWVKRLADSYVGSIGGDFMDRHATIAFTLKSFDVVRFRNGYSSDSPCIDVKVKDIRIGTGKPEWGAEPNKNYFIIELINQP